MARRDFLLEMILSRYGLGYETPTPKKQNTRTSVCAKVRKIIVSDPLRADGSAGAPEDDNACDSVG